MSEISNEQVYLGLNRIYFMTKKLSFVLGGVFESTGNLEIGAYVPGTIFRTNEDLFDDSEYKDRDALFLQFSHHFLSSVGLKFGPSHPHERIIISKDPNLSIRHLYFQASNGDLFIFGQPYKSNGEAILDAVGEVRLWEIEPFYLDKDDMTRIIENVHACSIFKKEMIDAKTLAFEATTEAALQLSRSVAAESVNITYYTIITTLLAKLERYNKKLIEMRISVSDKLEAGINMIEENLDLGVPWDTVTEDKVNTLMENTRSDINYLTALKNLNANPSDQVKEHAWMLTIQICGIDWIRQRSMVLDPANPPKSINTFSGLSTNYLQRQMQANPDPQQLLKSVVEMNHMLRDKYEQNGGDMQRAISDMNNALNTDPRNGFENAYTQTPTSINRRQLPNGTTNQPITQ